MPEATIEEERRKLQEARDRLNELLTGKREKLASDRKETRRKSGELVETLEQPVQSDSYYNPAGPRMQNVLDIMFGEYDRLSMLTNRDMNEIVDEDMKGKNPYLVFLKNFLTGYGNPQAMSVSERLLARKMETRKLRLQRMNSIQATFSTMGATDARNLASRTTGRGQAATAANQSLKAEQTEQQSRQGANQAIAKEIFDSELTQASGEDKMDYAFEIRKREIDYMRKSDVKLLKQKKTLGAFYSTYARMGDAELMPVAYRTDGTVIQQYHAQNKDTGKFIRNDQFKPQVERTTKRIEKIAALSEFSQGIEEVSAFFASNLAENKREGRTFELLLANAFKPVLGFMGLAGIETPEFMKAFELSANDTIFLHAQFKQVLAKVKEISGQQVSDKEREYVETTLPSLMTKASTYGMGLELTRLWSGWRLAMVNEAETDASGLTPLTKLDEGDKLISYRDYTPQLLALQAIAQKIRDKGQVGDGAKFLASIDADRPQDYQAKIDEYYGPTDAVMTDAVAGRF